MEMERTTLIDTSAWIEFLRPDGDPAVAERVTDALDEGRAAWTHMVMLELWNGAGNEEERAKLRRIERVLPLLETSPAVWDDARSLAVRLRAAGKTVPATDLVIFASARRHHAALIHNDRHFDWLLSMPNQ